MKLIVIALVAASLTGCGLGARLGGGAGLKTVAAKEEPITLVALDGMVCQVTPQKFHETRTGDRVWCGWHRRGDGPGPGTVWRRPPIGG